MHLDPGPDRATRWMKAAFAAAGLLAMLAGCVTTGGPVARPAHRTSDNDLVTASDQTGNDRQFATRMELAQGYLGRGQPTDALDEVKLALQLKPNDPAAYGLRGFIYAALSQPEKADESFRRALQLAPHDGDLMHNYGWFLCQQRRFPDADAQFVATLAEPSYRQPARTMLAQGVCQASAGKLSDAEHTLSRAYELDPANPTTAVNLAEVLYRNAQYDRARFYIRRVNSRQDLVSARTLWIAARIERKLNQDEQVQALGLQLRNRFPESPKHCCSRRASSMNDVPMAEPLEPGDDVAPAAAATHDRDAGRLDGADASPASVDMRSFVPLDHEPAAVASPQSSPPTAPPTAGTIIRHAREAQGLDLASLAAMLKIPLRRLDALENGRHDELQGPTFERALAQAACRVLKIDPKPVLALLPQHERNTLERVTDGINTPFRDGQGGGLELPTLARPVVILVVLLIAAAVALFVVPDGWLARVTHPIAASFSVPDAPASAPASAASSADTPASAASLATPVPSPAASVGPQAAQATQSPASVASQATLTPAAVSATAAQGIDEVLAHVASAPNIPLQVVATEDSWVEVVDAQGHSLLSRTVVAGESVGLDGALPMRVKIGNAGGTHLKLRGDNVDLTPWTRDNVARLELK